MQTGRPESFAMRKMYPMDAQTDVEKFAAAKSSSYGQEWLVSAGFHYGIESQICGSVN